MAVVAKEAGQILHLIASPGLSEQGIQLGLDCRLRRIHGYHSLTVVRRVEKIVPGIGLSVHILEIRIERVKVPDPGTVSNPSPEESGGRVEYILPVTGMLHHQPVTWPVTHRPGHLCHCIVVVGILQSLGNRTLVLVIIWDIDGILLSNPAIFEILVKISASPLSGHSGIAVQQLISLSDVITFPDAAGPDSRNIGRRMISVEECRHITCPFLTHLNDGCGNIRSHIRPHHGQKNQLIAVVIPE